MGKDKILDTEITVEGRQTTLRKEIWKLGTDVWKRQQGFSGKRPYGDSGYYHNVVRGLVEKRLVPGVMKNEGTDDDPWWYADFDWKEVDGIIHPLLDDNSNT
jgi:hypothetical protein